MIERILEPVMTRIMGEYIEGFSREQLSVSIWSGNVNISNVRVKKNVLSKFGLPFQLEFGLIQNMSFAIPWKNLGTKPLEVRLRGLYVIVTPTERGAWAQLLEDPLKAKHAATLAFARSTVEVVAERLKSLEKEGEKGPGYFALLLEKIIDNLHVQVEDVHLRLESGEGPLRSFSFGATLNALSLCTCDADWRPTFTDRQADGQHELHKRLELKDFYIYWNAEEEDFLAARADDAEGCVAALRRRIYREDSKDSAEVRALSYFFSFSTEGKLYQQPLTAALAAAGTPVYDLSIELEKLALTLRKEQVGQLSRVLEAVNDFSTFRRARARARRFLSLRPARRLADAAPAERPALAREWWRYALLAATLARPTARRLLRLWALLTARKPALKRDFAELLLQPMADKKAPESIEDVAPAERLRYENALAGLTDAELRAVVERHVKATQLRREVDRKLRTAGGFFGSWFGGRRREDADELEKNLQALLDSVDVGAARERVEVPEHYAKLRLRLHQKNFSVTLRRGEESVELVTQELAVEASFRKSGVRVAAQLAALNLFFAQPAAPRLELLFCREHAGDFLRVLYEDRPPARPGLDTCIEAEMGALVYVNNAEMAAALVDIFRLEELDDAVSEKISAKAEEGLERARDIGEQNMLLLLRAQPKVFLSVRVESPQIFLPVRDAAGGGAPPCWVLYPGNLSIAADTAAAAGPYTRYTLSLADIQFGFCRALPPDGRPPAPADYAPLFRDFDIQVAVETLRRAESLENPGADRLRLGARLTPLRVDVSAANLRRLLHITNDVIARDASAKRSEKRRVLRQAGRKGFALVRSSGGLVSLRGESSAYLLLALHRRTLYFYGDVADAHGPRHALSLRRAEVGAEPAQASVTLDAAGQQFALQFEGAAECAEWADALRAAAAADEPAAAPAPREGESLTADVVVNFEFERLELSVADGPETFLLGAEALRLHLTKKEAATRASLELGAVRLTHLREDQCVSLLSSEREDAAAPAKLVSVAVARDADGTRVCADFGSLFVRLEPEKIERLRALLARSAGDEARSLSQTSTLDLSVEDELGPQLYAHLARAPDKFTSVRESPLGLLLELTVQDVTLLLVSSPRGLPLARASLKDSSLRLELFQAGFCLAGRFSALELFDLTGFPRTSTSVDAPGAPARVLGNGQKDGARSLMEVEMCGMDPLYANVPESLAASEIRVVLHELEVVLHLRVIMRLSNFFTEQLLPALLPEDADEPGAARSPDFITRRRQYIRLMRPFWPRLRVSVTNTRFRIPISADEKVEAVLDELTVVNARRPAADRLLGPPPDKGPDVLWVNDYAISVGELALVHSLRAGEGEDAKKLAALSVQVSVELLHGEEELQALFGARPVVNLRQQQVATELRDPAEADLSPEAVAYDPAVRVGVQLSPFVLLVGTREFGAITAAVDAFLLDEFKDQFYIKDYIRRQASGRAAPYLLSLHAVNVGLVSIDNRRADLPSGKVFLEDVLLEAIGLPDGRTGLTASVQALRGYALVEDGDRLHEKGFVGDLHVTRVFAPGPVEELRAQFLSDLFPAEDRGACRFRSPLLPARAPSAARGAPPTVAVRGTFCPQDNNFSVAVEGLKMILETPIILRLVPTFPPRDPRPTRELQREGLLALRGEQPASEPLLPQMRVEVRIANTTFLLPSVDEEFVLATQGDIELKLVLQPEAGGTEAGEAEPGAPRLLRSTLHAKLSNFELYLCRFMDLFTYARESLPKRYLLRPLEAELQLSQFRAEGAVPAVTKIVLELGAMHCTTTMNDAKLLAAIVQHHRACLDEFAQGQPRAPAAEEARRAAAPSYTYLSASVAQNFLWTLINDHDEIFTPTLTVQATEVRLLLDAAAETRLCFTLALAAFYFNSEAFKWEPLVEKTAYNAEFSAAPLPGAAGWARHLLVYPKGAKRLNVNLSLLGLERLLFVYRAFEAMRAQTAGAAEQPSAERRRALLHALRPEAVQALRVAPRTDRPLSYVSPVRVLNTTGYAIEVQHYVKRIQMGEEGRLRYHTVHDAPLRVENGLELPLTVAQTDEDFAAPGGALSTSFTYKFVSVTVLHPAYHIDKLKGLNILLNVSRKLTLAGREKTLGDFRVYYNCRNNRDLKELHFSSPLRFENGLAAPVCLRVRHPGEGREFVVAPGAHLFLPFDLLHFVFGLRVGEREAGVEARLDEFLIKEAGYHRVVRAPGGDLTFMLRVARDPGFYYLTRLAAVPALHFQNKLPLPVALTLFTGGGVTPVELPPQGEVAFCELDIALNVSFTLQVQGFGPTDPTPLLSHARPVEPRVLHVLDARGGEGWVNVLRARDGAGHFSFCFYCDLLVVNDTDYDLDFRPSAGRRGEGRAWVGGRQAGQLQRFGLLSSAQTHLEVRLHPGQALVSAGGSNSAPLQGVGAGTFVLPARHGNSLAALGGRAEAAPSVFVELGFSLRLHYADDARVAAAKVVAIRPRNVLHNYSQAHVSLFSAAGRLTLAPGERRPLCEFGWSEEREKVADFAVAADGRTYNALCALRLAAPGSAFFLLVNAADGADFRIFRVEVALQSEYAVVGFADRTGCADLVFLNRTPYRAALVQPHAEGAIALEVAAGARREFGLVSPYGDRRVTLQFAADGAAAGAVTVDLRQLGAGVLHGDRQAFGYRFHLERDNRCLEVWLAEAEARGQPARAAADAQPARAYTSIDVTVAALGLSLIGRHHNNRVEFFYVYLDRVRFIAVLAAEQQELQLAVNYVNVDSNYAPPAKYPVLLTTAKPLKAIREAELNCVNFHCIRNAAAAGVASFDLIELQVLPLAVTADYSLVPAVLALKAQVERLFAAAPESGYLQRYLGAAGAEWRAAAAPAADRMIFIREFKVAPVQVLLTFSLGGYGEGGREAAEDTPVDLLVRTLGVTLLNVDESPIVLAGLKLQHVFESQQAFLGLLQTHLLDQQRRNALRLVGSLDIIGNPVSLFANVGNGFIEFFEKPVEGFIKGPVEGVVGIAAGSTSLIKNTAAGAFNTISRFTNSLAAGLVALSMDKEYLHHRNLHRADRPAGIVEGLEKGVSSLGQGIVSGVAGLVTQPLNEVKRKGAPGIFRGIVKGFSGLITKPVGGVLDATSQAAEGFKKAITFFDDKTNEKKQRVPRVFYSSFKFFKEYQPADALIMLQLKKLKRGMFEEDTFLDSVKIKDGAGKVYFLVFTSEHMLLLNKSVERVVVCLDISKIQAVKPTCATQIAIVSAEAAEPLMINAKDSTVLKIINAYNYCRYVGYANFK